MGTTSDKLTYLNTTKNKIKDVINMTGANITSDTTFRNYATKLYDGYINVLKDKNTLLDNMPKGTSTGTITDAVDLPVYEDKMSKESSQETTTGVQLANIDDYSATKLGVNVSCINNEFVLNGINSVGSLIGSGGSSGNLYMATLPAGTYTFSFKKISGSLTYSSGSSAFYIRKSNGQSIKGLNITSTTNNTTTIFSLSEETSVYLEYYVNTSNWEFTNYDFQIMILSGDYTSSIIPDFEKYTGGQPSPNPDYPQEIKTVKGYKNLFDKTLTSIVNNRLKTEILSTGIRVICNIRETSLQANNAVRYVTIDVTNYIGKKISLFCHAKSSSTNKGFFYLRLCNQNGDTNNSYGTQTSAETLDGDLSVTYEIPSGIGEYHYLMIAIYGNRNSPCEINDYVDYTNLMLVEGENKYPYVPYGTNWIYKKIIGKNWCNSKSSNKYCDSNGTIRVGSTLYLGVSDYIKVSPGTQYTITFEDYNNGNLYYGAYDENKRFIKRVNAGTGKTFTLADDVYYIFPYLFDSGYSTINGNIQIEKGAVSTEYEEYKESIVTLPLRDNEVVGIDTTKNEYIIDKNGHCWLNKKIGKVVLDGINNSFTSVGSTNTTGVHRFMTADIGSKLSTSSTEIIPAFCNRLISKSLDDTYVKQEGFSFLNSTHRISIYIDEISTYTLEQANEWLSTHNLELYYPLAQEDLIDLNYTVDLTLFEGVNNISNSEDMDMEIKYIKESYE